MAHKIIETCVECGACLYEYPYDAITEGENQYIIDPGVGIPKD